MPTSTTGFLGYTSTGPVNQATEVLSFAAFESTFGGLAEDSPVSYAVRDFFTNGGTQAWVVRIVGAAASPDAPQPGDFRGDRAAQTGVWALDQATDVELLCVPGQADPDLLEDLGRYCERRRAFFIADMPGDIATAQAAWSWATGLRGVTLKRYAAAYFPWLLIPDPLQGDTPTQRSPSGALAGLLARFDSDYGVWAATAGSAAVLLGLTGLTPLLTDAESALLSTFGVNPIREVPDAGPVVWGARTLGGRDRAAGEWNYISVRRFALFLESSVEAGTQWAAFEPNDEPTWSELRRAVEAFMEGLFLQGAFQGPSPERSYFVRCDQCTTSSDDVAGGVANVLVGFAPLRPDEFSTVSVPVRCGWLGL